MAREGKLPPTWVDGSLGDTNGWRTNFSARDMAVFVKGNKIRCAWKYNATQDMWLDFDKLGSNGIIQMYDVWKLPNTKSKVSMNLDQSATYFYNIRSDMVGPYVAKASGGLVNGFSGFSFSGGIHAFDGTSPVNAPFPLPSASMVSIKVFADGTPIADGETVSCDRIDIEVINDIQGNNTTTVGGRALTPSANFVPRAILRETVHYTVTPGSVEVTNDIQALEALTIERYYGIQSVAQGIFTKVHYVNGQQSALTDINGSVTSDSGVKSSFPSVDRFVYSNNARNDFHVAWMDNTYGLGQRANVAATEKLAFSTTIPKSYFSLVYSSNLVLAAGQVVSWRGGYVWTESLPCPGADMAFTYREGNQTKYVVDFLAASASSVLATKQDDRNKSVIVDSKSAAVTVPSRTGSTGMTLSSTGYGQAKTTVS